MMLPGGAHRAVPLRHGKRARPVHQQANACGTGINSPRQHHASTPPIRRSRDSKGALRCAGSDSLPGCFCHTFEWYYLPQAEAPQRVFESSLRVCAPLFGQRCVSEPGNERDYQHRDMIRERNCLLTLRLPAQAVPDIQLPMLPVPSGQQSESSCGRQFSTVTTVRRR